MVKDAMESVYSRAGINFVFVSNIIFPELVCGQHMCMVSTLDEGKRSLYRIS